MMTLCGGGSHGATKNEERGYSLIAKQIEGFSPVFQDDVAEPPVRDAAPPDHESRTKIINVLDTSI